MEHPSLDGMSTEERYGVLKAQADALVERLNGYDQEMEQITEFKEQDTAELKKTLAEMKRLKQSPATSKSKPPPAKAPVKSLKKLGQGIPKPSRNPPNELYANSEFARCYAIKGDGDFNRLVKNEYVKRVRSRNGKKGRVKDQVSRGKRYGKFVLEVAEAFVRNADAYTKEATFDECLRIFALKKGTKGGFRLCNRQRIARLLDPKTYPKGGPVLAKDDQGLKRYDEHNAAMLVAIALYNEMKRAANPPQQPSAEAEGDENKSDDEPEAMGSDADEDADDDDDDDDDDEWNSDANRDSDDDDPGSDSSSDEVVPKGKRPKTQDETMVSGKEAHKAMLTDSEDDDE